MALFNIEDEVKIVYGAQYLNNGKPVPENALMTKLFVRNVTKDGYIVARAKTGPILGEVAEKFLKDAAENEATIKPYYIRTIDSTPLYQGATKNSGVIDRLRDGLLLTIVSEKNGFGKIRMGAGWVELKKVKRI